MDIRRSPDVICLLLDTLDLAGWSKFPSPKSAASGCFETCDGFHLKILLKAKLAPFATVAGLLVAAEGCSRLGRQVRARASARSKDWQAAITSHSWRTSSPVPPDLFGTHRSGASVMRSQIKLCSSA